jgi:CRISPR system Cascade subunit CasA
MSCSLTNAVRVDGAQGEPFEFDPSEDRPAWESEPPARGERRPLGYLDLLTWQFRRIRLLADRAGLASQAVIMDGWALPGDLDVSTRETMVAYRRAPKGSSGMPAWLPIAFESERALWRDGTALLRWSQGPRDAGEVRPPRVLRWVAELTQYGVLPPDFVVAVAAYGISANRSKLELWRHERLPLPLAYFDDPEIAVALAEEISLAERVEEVLEEAVYDLCRRAVSRNQPEDRRRVRALSDALQWRLQYWSRLDEPALALMVDLPRDRGQAKARWEHELRRSAQEAFEGSALALATSVTGMRSAALVRPWFLSKLARVVKPSSLGSQEATKEEAM